MRRVYIKDLKLSDVLLNHSFAVKEFLKKKGKTGNEYYDFVLSDKTGQITGKLWSSNFLNIDSKVKRGDVVLVTGRVDEFLEKPQIIIEKLVVAEDFDPSVFLDTGSRNAEELWDFIMNLVSELDDPDVSDAILKVFSNKKIDSLYKSVPAAEIVHHNYVGGLLEHVYEMLVLSRPIKNLYTEVNYNLLVMGIIFHDIGKIEEYTTTGVTLERTLSGYLLGHMAQGILLLEKELKDQFPSQKKERLYHMILSHHGSKENGSPVQPMTLEAILLSSLDDSSSRMGIYYSHLKQQETGGNSSISGYSKYLGAHLLVEDM